MRSAARLARSTAAVLAVMATVMAAVLLVGGEALAQTETEHWSATLTRGDGVAASSGNHGYVAATETGPGGMLDPSTFTYATSTEPIVSLSLNFEADPVFSSLPPGELDASAQGSTTYYFPHLAVGRAAAAHRREGG